LQQPTVPIVLAAGCASRTPDGTWTLASASALRRSSIVHADAREFEEARRLPIGTARYRLIGTAEFASVDDLLSTGQRAQFTTAETANATGQLRDGRRVAVKALLIAAAQEQRLNLLSVQPVSDSCP
jgi:hypothetical protein